MIITEHIDVEKHKKAYNIWGSLLFLGDPLIVYFSYYLFSHHISWQTTFVVMVGIFTMTTFSIQFALPEVQMKEDVQK